MVNLRYHIVSLIAVFLALAVGVVLGAGPLQRQISGEGGSSAQRVGVLEDQVAAQKVVVEESATFIGAVSSQISQDVLSNTEAVIVALPGVPASDSAQVEEVLLGAGAKVSGTLALMPDWMSNAKREYRDSLAGQLSSHLEGTNADMTGDQILATALVQTLTASSKDLDLARQILSDSANPLVVADTYPQSSANAVVVVGPFGSVDEFLVGETTQSGDGGGEPDVSEQRALTALAEAAGNVKGASVIVGRAKESDDFVAIVRDAGVGVNTVDQAGTQMAGLNMVLALASSTKGAYGQELGATSPVAPLPNK